MPILKFKVLSVKRRKWWWPFGNARRVFMQIQHDDPNDWPLDGQLHFHVKTAAEAAMFEVGQVYGVALTLDGDVIF